MVRKEVFGQTLDFVHGAAERTLAEIEARSPSRRRSPSPSQHSATSLCDADATSAKAMPSGVGVVNGVLPCLNPETGTATRWC